MSESTTMRLEKLTLYRPQTTEYVAGTEPPEGVRGELLICRAEAPQNIRLRFDLRVPTLPNVRSADMDLWVARTLCGALQEAIRTMPFVGR